MPPLTIQQQQTRQKMIDAAQRYGAPTDLVPAVGKIESGYGVNNGPSSAGAKGPMQFMPTTAAAVARQHNKEYGTNWTGQDVLNDNDININAGAYHLGQLLKSAGGDHDKALYNYNHSTKYVQDVLNQRDVEQQQGVQPFTPVDTTDRAQSMPTAQTPFQPLQMTPVNQGGVAQAVSPVDTAGDNSQQPWQLEYAAQAAKGADLAKQMTATGERLRSGGTDSAGGDSGSIGMAPKVLAVIAALTGNFGPAMMLHEQERKTAVARQAFPLFNEANRLERSGKYDEAIDYIQQAFSKFGSRSPEIAQYSQTLLNRLNIDRQNYSEAQARYAVTDKMVKATEEQTGQPDPRRAMLDVIGTALKHGPAGAAALKDMLAKAELKTMNVPGAGMATASEQSGLVSYTPTPAQFDIDALKTPTGMQFQQSVNMPANQIARMMNGIRAVDNQGNVVFDPRDTSGTSQKNLNSLRTGFAQVQGLQGQQEVVAKAPIPPDVNVILAGIKNSDGTPKYTVNQIAARQISPDDLKAGFARYAEIARMQGTGQREAEYYAPSGVSTSGNIVFDLQSGQRMPHMSFAEAGAMPDRYATIGKDQAAPAANLIQLRNRLNLLSQEVGKLPEYSNIDARFGNYVDRTLNRYLNVNADMKGRQALEAVVKDDLERYFNSRNIAATTYKDITSGIIGPTATKESAVDALQRLDTLLSRDLQQLQNEGGTAPAPANVTAPQAAPTPVGTVPGVKRGTLR